jgi:hypothetical protein
VLKTFHEETTEGRSMTPNDIEKLGKLRSQFLVLLRFSWLIRAGFQAEFSARKENTNSVMFEDTKASRCGLYALDAAVES